METPTREITEPVAKGSPEIEIVVPTDPIEVRQIVRKQVEYYFSKENLQHDPYLTSQMDAQMSVPIAVVMKFPKIKHLTQDEAVLRAALVGSSTVSIVENKIKANIKAQGRSTIILRDIPSECGEDEVRSIFAFEGCKPISSVRRDIENTWFVIMDSEEDAKDTMLDIKLKKRTIRGESVKCRLKTEAVVKSFYPVTAPPIPSPTFAPGPFMMGGYGGVDMRMYGYVNGGAPGSSWGERGSGPLNEFSNEQQSQALPVAASSADDSHVAAAVGAKKSSSSSSGNASAANSGAGNVSGKDSAAKSAGGAPSGGAAGAGGNKSGGGSSQQNGTQQKRGNGQQNNNRDGNHRGGNNNGGNGGSSARSGNGNGNGGNNRRQNQQTGKGGDKHEKGGNNKHTDHGIQINAAEFPPLASSEDASSPAAAASSSSSSAGHGYSSSSSSLSAYRPAPTPVAQPGYQGEYLKYTHDDIVGIVKNIAGVVLPTSIKPEQHSFAMTREPNTDLLLRQRTFSIDETREQLRQGRPVHKDAVIGGAVDYESMFFGDVSPTATSVIPATVAGASNKPVTSNKAAAGSGSWAGILMKSGPAQEQTHPPKPVPSGAAAAPSAGTTSSPKKSSSAPAAAVVTSAAAAAPSSVSGASDALSGSAASAVNAAVSSSSSGEVKAAVGADAEKKTAVAEQSAVQQKIAEKKGKGRGKDGKKSKGDDADGSKEDVAVLSSWGGRPTFANVLKQQAEQEAAAAVVSPPKPVPAAAAPAPSARNNASRGDRGGSRSGQKSGADGNRSSGGFGNSAETRLKANSAEPWGKEKLPPVPDKK